MINNMSNLKGGLGRSSVVRAFTHGAMGRQIDPSGVDQLSYFSFPASAPRLV